MALRKVKIESGMVEGTVSAIPTISVFRSIPYAAPPVGENRWRAPQPVEPWEGVRSAFTFKAAPPRGFGKPGDVSYDEWYGFGDTEPMDEDCLHLSIWTPASSAEESLPVLFHVHGGGFVEGYSYAPSFYGEAFARQGIVFVSVEYRLGILGFLSHPLLTAEAPYHASGNYGLLDQVAALHWVRRNIRAFGGDPDRITINGQSAGAISCAYLMYSPLTQNDLCGAIFQSGLGYTNHKNMRFIVVRHDETLTQAQERGQMIFESLGVRTLEEARALPWQTILQWQIDHPDCFLWPVIDGYFIPRNLDDTIDEGTGREIPIIVGTTMEEGIALGGTLQSSAQDPASFRKEMEEIYGSFTDKYLSFNGFEEDPASIMAPSVLWEEMNAASLAWCEKALSAGRKQPVYHYLFSRDVPGRNGGPGHSMDLWYSFGTLDFSSHPKEACDYRLQETMNTYFANFVKTGDPNDDHHPAWTPFSRTNRKVMELGEHIGMIPNYSTPRIQMLVDHILEDL